MADLPDYFSPDRPHVPGSEELPSAAPMPVPLTRYAWTPLTGWAVTALLLLSIVVFGGGSSLVQTREMSTDLRAALGGIMLSLAYVVPLSVLVVVARRVGMTASDLVGLRPAPWRPVVFLGVAVGVLGRLVVALWAVMIDVLGVRIPGEPGDPLDLLPSGALGLTLILFATVILAPLAEEVVFRGVLLPSLHDRWGKSAAMAMSSVVFAAAHFEPVTLPPLFLFALMLSWIFIRSRTLWTAVIAHATFNGIGFALYFLLRTTVA